MAYYEPPTEQLPIFNPSVFVNEDEALTLASASRYFLKYPNAQGTENLLDVNVNGVMTANSDIILNNTATFTWNNADSNYLINNAYPKVGTGQNNTAFGPTALTSLTTGYENCCLGEQSGQRIDTGNDNTIVGTNSGFNITSGSANTILGQNTGVALTTSDNNTLIGRNCAPNLTGTNNVSVGEQSNFLITDITTSNSTALGCQSTNNNFDFSTALGFGATNTSANQIMLGRNTETTYHPGNIVWSPTTNIQWDRTDLNYLINDNAGSKSITSGQGNVALGHNCLDLVNSGTNNVGIGRSAGRTISTGSSNICIGAFAGDAITTGVGSVFIGVNAGSKTNNTSVAIGRNALQNLTSGQYNVAIGEATSQNITTQNQTTCIGYNACANGGNNTTAYGFQSLQNATGGSNTAVGNQSGSGITTGASNLCLGHQANQTGNTTLNNSCAIGASSSNANFSNSVALGYQATNTSANQIRLGTATENVSCPGTLTFKTTSDNTAGTYYIPFSKTSAGTEGQLYIDDTTGPLTYNPSTSTLTCAIYDGQTATSDVRFGNSLTTGNLYIGYNAGGGVNCHIVPNGAFTGTCYVFGGSVSAEMFVRGKFKVQYGIKTSTASAGAPTQTDNLGYTTSKTTGWLNFGASATDINSITIDGTTIAFGVYRIEVYLNYSSDIDNTIQLGVSTSSATFQNPSINKFSPAGKNDGIYYCKTISAYTNTTFYIVADGLAGSTTTLDTSGTDGCNITLTRL